jgi:hypothetical protein
MNVWSVGANKVQIHSFLASVIARGECSTSRLSGIGLEKEPGTHRIGDWVGFRVRVGVVEKENCLATSWKRRRRQQHNMNNVFEMLLYCLCVYVVHFQLALQISVCGSAKIPAFSAHTVSKHVAARVEVFV